MRCFWDFVRRRHHRLYHVTVRGNYEHDVGVEVFGLKDDPSVLWVYNFLTLLHHGTAGLLMFAGMYFESPAIWRHGLLTQLCGMDIVDFIKIAWCKLAPPGPYPVRNSVACEGYVAFISFHHSVSLLAGIPTSIYFAENPDFQCLGALLAGGPLVFVAWDLFARTIDARHRLFHLASEGYINSMFFYHRVIIFFPLAKSLLTVVYGSSVPLWAKISLFLGGASMSMFNVICLGMMVMQWGIKIKKFRADSKGVDDASNNDKTPTVESEAGAGSSSDETPLPTMLTGPRPVYKDPRGDAIKEPKKVQ
eukprot:TRINITY_DN3430_c0_g1_i3.p1 TRINITY_DN3430_c0_g1~~TRINITY_DN3430_c0_g1_i3.p1  ORF type:complete len:306 (-),score=60.15 TRINITY_DN3430_c0_g1_i3:231-1148(-)